MLQLWGRKDVAAEEAAAKAEAEEAAEIAELQAMLKRDEAVSVSRFNRWSVRRDNLETGLSVKREEDEWRRDIQAANEEHAKYGRALQDASRQQLAATKEMLSRRVQANQQHASEVRREVSQGKLRAEAARQQHMQHGRRRAQEQEAQRARVRQIRSHGSREVVETGAAKKQQRSEAQRVLAVRRSSILEDNRREVLAVQERTSCAVIDEARQYAYGQRKGLAEGTKKSTASLRDERHRQTQSFLSKAASIKAETLATRERVRAQHAERTRTNQAEAKRIRARGQQMRQASASTRSSTASDARKVRDAVYRSKFISDAQRKAMASSPIGIGDRDF